MHHSPMNIVLIHPYIHTSTPIMYLNEPMGLISLATHLKHQLGDKVEISIVDLYEKGWRNIVEDNGNYNIGISEPSEIKRLVAENTPDIIGISCNFTSYTKASYKIAHLMKTFFPEALLVMGGAHPSMDYEGAFSSCPIDVVVVGEGELTFLELVKAVQNSSPLKNVKGLIYRDGTGIHRNESRELMKNISVLPVPDRSYVNQETYCKINRKMYFLSRGKRVASIMTSRGCPFECTFCSTHLVWKRFFRLRPSEAVIDEMAYLRKNYGIDEFIINDDQFFGNKKRVYAILDAIFKKGWKIYLNIASGASVWLLNEDLLMKLKKAGLYRVTFPIETGNENSRAYIKKKIDFDSTRKLVKTANHLGIWTYANFIIGFPYETRREIAKTVNYAVSLGLDNATFFVAKPYAGSKMYDHFRKEGLLDMDAQCTMGEADHGTVHLLREELQSIRNRAQLRVYLQVIKNYLNPLFFFKFMIPKLARIEDLTYFIRYISNTIYTQLLKT